MKQLNKAQMLAECVKEFKEEFDVFFDEDGINTIPRKDFKKSLYDLYDAEINGVFLPRRSQIYVFEKVEEGFEWFSFVKFDDWGYLAEIQHNVNPNEPLSEDFDGFYIKCRLCVDRDEDEGEEVLLPYVEYKII